MCCSFHVYLPDCNIVADEGSDQTYSFISKQPLDQTDPGQALVTFNSLDFSPNKTPNNKENIQPATRMETDYVTDVTTESRYAKPTNVA